jgi:hypothetical protein
VDGTQARVAGRINPSGGCAKAHLPGENHATYVALAPRRSRDRPSIEARNRVFAGTVVDQMIPSFARHLNEFTEDKRGPILKKIGTPRRFRFINPLMQPYVIMQGCQQGKIKV